MSKPKFLADEHIKLPVVKTLKQEGIDILSVQEMGEKGIDDLSLLTYARKQQRSIITRDVDFLNLAGEGRHHAGIIFLTKRLRIGRIIKQVEKLALLYERNELKDTIMYLPF